MTSSETLLLDPLRKAIDSLEDILKQPMDEYRRDGTIQRFEYTFELCWKFMQRVLESEGDSVGSLKQVIQSALKAGLIIDLDAWLAFLKTRNLSAHTYNQKVAEEVFKQAKQFPPFARQVLHAIQTRGTFPTK